MLDDENYSLKAHCNQLTQKIDKLVRANIEL